MSDQGFVDIVVAGHICLDIIPTFDGAGSSGNGFPVPGKLAMVGPALLATGGAVSNTGLALDRLGIRTRLMGKIGYDLFGRAILDIISRQNAELTEGMVVAPDADSSYTVVISPPGLDRSFLHCPGANNTFGASDIDEAQLQAARLLHFGYPPLMARFYADEGAELAALLRTAKAYGLMTSLDMAQVDPTSLAAAVDWHALLRRTLPSVDVFLPSFEEILFMVDRPAYAEFAALTDASNPFTSPSLSLLRKLSSCLLDWGAAVVLLKLGEGGMYLRTTDDPRRLHATGRVRLTSRWLDRECFVPAFQVQVVGTTGAGDCAIAGFLAGLLRGLEPEATLSSAAAAGAANVEKADAVSGIPTWTELQDRIRSGWTQRELAVSLPDWNWDAHHGLWRSPFDRES